MYPDFATALIAREALGILIYPAELLIGLVVVERPGRQLARWHQLQHAYGLLGFGFSTNSAFRTVHILINRLSVLFHAGDKRLFSQSLLYRLSA